MKRDAIIAAIGKPRTTEWDVLWRTDRRDQHFRHESHPIGSYRNAGIRLTYNSRGELKWKSLATEFHLRREEIDPVRIGMSRDEIVKTFDFSASRYSTTLYEPSVKFHVSNEQGRQRRLVISRHEFYPLHDRVLDQSAVKETPNKLLQLYFAPDDRLVNWRLEDHTQESNVLRARTAAGISKQGVRPQPIDPIIQALASDRVGSVYLARQAIEKQFPEAAKISLQKPRADSRAVVRELVKKLTTLDHDRQLAIAKAFHDRARFHSPMTFEPWE